MPSPIEKNTGSFFESIYSLLSSQNHRCPPQLVALEPWVYVAQLPDQQGKLRDLKAAAQDLVAAVSEEKRQSYTLIFAHECTTHYLSLIKKHPLTPPLPSSLFSNLVFFLDHVQLAKSLPSLVRKYHYTVIHNSSGVLICYDKFRLQLDYSAMIIDMIAQNKSLHETISDMLAELPTRFKHCTLIAQHYSTLATQELTFKNGKYGAFIDDQHCELDYQNTSELFSDTASLRAYLSECTSTDLLNLGGIPVFSIRSYLYPLARPKSTHAQKDGYCLSFDWEKNGRLTTHERAQGEIFLSYQTLLRNKYAAQRSFKARVIVGQELKAAGFYLLGDKIASILSNPQLIAGLVHALGADPQKTWRVFSRHENMIMLVPKKISRTELNHLKRCAKYLSAVILPEGADPIKIQLIHQPGEIPVGKFELNRVASEFFELMRVVEQPEGNLIVLKKHYLRGLALELIQEWGQASKAFMRAHRLDRGDYEICFALGRCMYESRKSDEAIFFLRQALQLSPLRADISNLLGLSYLEKGLFEEALNELEQAASLAPTQTQYLTDLGRCYFLAGAYFEAKEALNYVLEQEADNTEAHLLLAEISYQEQNYSSALSHTQDAQMLQPTNEQIADLLSNLEDRDKSEE